MAYAALYFQHIPNDNQHKSEQMRKLTAQHENIIRSAKQIINNGKEIENSTIENALETINNNTELYNNILRLHRIELYLIKAQLLHKLFRCTTAQEMYEKVISCYKRHKTYSKKELIIFAKAYIGIANIVYRKIETFKENLNEGIDKQLENGDSYYSQKSKLEKKLPKHIKKAKKLLSKDINEVENIMGKFDWPSGEQNNVVEKLINDQKSNRLLLSILLRK